MRTILSLLACSILHVALGATVEMRHTHGVFYPDLKQQPILQLKITGEPGEKITKLEFIDSKTTNPADIDAVIEKAAALIDVLKQDPRPSYQEDPGRVYGLAFAGYDVKFKVIDDCAYLQELIKL